MTHVVLMVLENAPAAQVLQDPGFTAIAKGGAVLRSSFGVAYHSLPNYLALTAGATPTATTRADCPQFDCLLTTPSIAGQLDTAGLDWQGFFGGSTKPCLTPTPGGGDRYVRGYVTHHNPFAYDPSVGASPQGGSALCQRHLRPLGEVGAVAAAGTLARYSLIVPDSCEDGHDQPCADGRPGGLTTSIPWLSRTVTAITTSPAWDSRSLLIVTYDESDGSDTSGCCGEPGGGRVATIMLSGLIRPGSASDRPYDHYSMLATIEDGLGLPRLGLAQNATPITDAFAG